MTQNNRSIRIGQIAVCSVSALILSLLFCMAIALLIENDTIPISAGPVVAWISLFVSIVLSICVIIGRRGESVAAEAAIAGVIDILVLLLLKLLIYPDSAISIVPSALSIAIAVGASLLYIRSPKKRSPKRKYSKRK